MPPGYNVSTTFDVTVADEAPTGTYRITLELVTASAPDTVLAAESGAINVIAAVPTVLWSEPLPKLATQGTVMELPLQVYSPAIGSGVLDLTIAGPGDDPATEEVESLAAEDVTIYGSDGSAVPPMALELVGQDLAGHGT